MLELLGSSIIHFIQATGYLGVFVLMALESALIPIPSEITMPFAGSLGTFNFWLLVLTGTLANLTGSLLAYGLGYLGEEKIPKIFRNREYYHALELFNKYGEAITFVSRLLPAVRTYISLPAGLAKMDLPKFVLYTSLGSLLWCTFLTYLGVILGQNWPVLSPYFHKFDAVIFGAAFLALAVYTYLRIKATRRP